MTISPNDARRRNCSGESLSVRIAWVRVLHGVVFAVVIILLFATPMLLLTAAVSTHSTLHEALVRFAAFWFPMWSLVVVWVTLDAAALLGFVGPRSDPTGPRGLLL